MENNLFAGDKHSFINTMLPAYQQVLIENNIDPIYAEYLVAQDALESGWGKSESGTYNFGGIKDFSGKGTSKTTKEEINGKLVSMKQDFRNFDSITDYLNYKINLLNSDNYKAFDGDGSINDFISRIVEGGYATDSTYNKKLSSVIYSVDPSLRRKSRKKEDKEIIPKVTKSAKNTSIEIPSWESLKPNINFSTKFNTNLNNWRVKSIQDILNKKGV